MHWPMQHKFCYIPPMVKPGFDLKGGGGVQNLQFLYMKKVIIHVHVNVYSIWDQFEKLKAIHLNTDILI